MVGARSVTILPLVFMCSAQVAVADALLLERYLLTDHPGGGLELDDSTGALTFSADRGSGLFLDVLEDSGSGALSLHVHGELYGGYELSTGDILGGTARLDLTYTNVTGSPSPGTLYEAVGHEGDTGTLTWGDKTFDFDLDDDFSARLGSDDHGIGGLSFWVGLDDDGEWLLKATPIPEPSSLALFGLGLAGVALARRRRGTSRR